MKRLFCTLLWILFVFAGYSQIGVFKSVIADTVKAKDYRFQQLPNYSVYGALQSITSGDQNLATPPGTTLQRPTVPSGKIILRFNTDSNALEYGNSSQVWKTLGTSSVQSFDTSSIPNFGLKVRSLHSGTSPILYNGITGNISIQPATSDQAGYLQQADWIAFNSKLPDPGSNGFLVRTGPSTTASRSWIAASNNVSIVNANGVSGNPSIDLNDTLSLAQLILNRIPAAAPTGDSFLYINRTTNLLEVRPAPTGGGGGGTFNKAGGGISFSGDSLFLNQSFTRGLFSGTSPISYNSSTGAISLTTVPISLGGTNSSASLSNNRIMQSSAGAIIEAPAITANRAVISDANGIPTHSTVTNTELSYVSGVTSSIQTQINGKLSNITGLITSGDNINITGSGTSGSPYIINSSEGASRSGVIPTGYAGGGVIVDSTGKVRHVDGIRNNMVSYNNVSDTVGFGRPVAHFSRVKQQTLVTGNNESLNLGKGSFTIGAWVKFDTLGGLAQAIISKDDYATKRGSSFYMAYYPDYNTGPYNGMVFQVEECCHSAPNDGTTWYVISQAPAITTNQWYFVVGMYDAISGEVKISVNGVLDSAAAPTGAANITETPFSIGGAAGGFDVNGLPIGGFLNGSISSAFAFQRLLTNTEITTLYNNTEAQIDPPGINPGIMQNGPTFSADVPTALSTYVNSVNYDGINDKTAMSSGVSVNALNSSISLWFKATNLGGMVLGHSGNSNAYIRVLNSTTIRVQTNITGTFVDYTVPTMSTGTWYNLIVTRGASNLTHVYLNGSESSTGGVSQTDDLTLDQVGLYWDGTTGGLNWDGKISDIRIYHSVLSGGDISNIQSNSATTAVPFLWYKLNEGSGTTNIDYGSAPVPHPLWYDELPVAMKYESPKTFISWWDLSEPYGTRYDARLRNTGGLRDSAVSNLLVDINKQDQEIYGSTRGGGNLYLRSTTHPTTKGKTIIDNALTIDGVNNRLGLGITDPDFDIVVKNNVGNGGELAFRNSSDVNVLRFGVDGTANTNLTAYGSVNITSGNGNSISLIPSTGVTIGPARATDYKLDVLEDRTGLTDTTRVIYAYMTNSTFNTTSYPIVAAALAGVANGTRTAGANKLTNVGVHGWAENGDVNIGGLFDNHVVMKQVDSINTPRNILWQDDSGYVRKAAVPAGVGITLASGTYTPTLTNEANITTSTAYQCQYLRVGNIVTVSGKVTIDYTSTGTTSMGISLPIASDIANNNEVAGTCNAEVNNGGVIRGDATNDRAQLYIFTGSSAGYDYFFTFTYQIL